MKNFKLSIGWCIVISLVLVVFGLSFGTVNGYNDDRAHVTALLEGDSGLMTVVGYRAADGLNLCVVAERHLSGDADVQTLRNAANALRAETKSLSAMKRADDALSAAFETVAKKLRANDGFNAAARDKNYLALLSSDFEQYGRHAIYATYNQAATDFNAKLEQNLGFVAKFFGVKACELFA